MAAHRPEFLALRQSCDACHERKIKCRRAVSDGSCLACIADGRSCRYRARRKPGRRKVAPSTSELFPPQSSTQSHRTSNYISDPWEGETFGIAEDSATARPLERTASRTYHGCSTTRPDSLASYFVTDAVPTSGQDVYDDPIVFIDPPLESLGDVADIEHLDAYVEIVAQHCDMSISPSTENPQAFVNSRALGYSERVNEAQNKPELFPGQTISRALFTPGHVMQDNPDCPIAFNSRSSTPTFGGLLSYIEKMEAHVCTLDDIILDPNVKDIAEVDVLCRIQRSVDIAAAAAFRFADEVKVSSSSEASGSPFCRSNTASESPAPDPPSWILSDQSTMDANGITVARKDFASPALSMALVSKMLDVCDRLERLDLPDSLPTEYMLFLKRVDLSLSHIIRVINKFSGSEYASGIAPMSEVHKRTSAIRRRIHESLRFWFEMSFDASMLSDPATAFENVADIVMYPER